MMINPEDKRKLKIGCIVAAFAILFYLCLQNFEGVVAIAKYILKLLNPFIIGLCIAFVLNQLMKAIETKILGRISDKKFPKIKKIKRPVSLITTLIISLGLVTLLIYFIIPQVANSVKQLGENMNSYLLAFEEFANKILAWFGVSTDLYETITSYISDIANAVINFLKNSLPEIFETTKNITSGVMNTFIGIIIAIYMLASKEKLLHNSKRILYAFVPQKRADYVMHVYRLVKVRFSGFVTGQITEAIIIGVLCFVGMSIFGMEYALLISVIIGITNMIPIIGPIIGAIPGAFIMLMIDPMKALWFVVFIVVLQQLESNLIYPKVVGDSIGLPGIWVLFAILIGGALFGLPGVLLGVPAFAVIYTLIGEHTEKRLKEKSLKV